MDAEFWLERWRDGRTHFHQDRITPPLKKYWSTLGLAADSRILVPLCGKSLDMIWLADQGFDVLGVELSTVAVEQFFTENALTPSVRTSAVGTHYRHDRIEIIAGDIFAVDKPTLATCTGVFDRAALVALPEALRARYVHHIYAQLPAHYQGLLITLDYPQTLMEGPPFCVADAEVQTLYSGHSRATLLSRRDMLDKEPKFVERGLTKMDTLTYHLAGCVKAVHHSEDAVPSVEANKSNISLTRP